MGNVMLEAKSPTCDSSGTTTQKTLLDKATFCLKIGLSTTAAAACIYWGGPLAAVTARSVFTHAYALKYGIPAIYETSYWSIYLPWREHFGALAYSYGPTVLGTVTGSVVFTATDVVKAIANKIASVKNILPKTEKVAPLTKETPPLKADEKTFDEEMEALIEQFAKLKITDEDHEILCKESHPIKIELIDAQAKPTPTLLICDNNPKEKRVLSLSCSDISPCKIPNIPLTRSI
jgi:hypothetical protein